MSVYVCFSMCMHSVYKLERRQTLGMILPDIVMHSFDPSTWEAEAGGWEEFEASLVYR